MTLDELIDKMLQAGTSEEIAEARREARRWIEEHPEDADIVLTAGESLAMKAEALEFIRQ